MVSQTRSSYVEKFSEEKGVTLNLYLSGCVYSEVLGKLIMKTVDSKHIGLKPMMRISINSSALFNIEKVKKKFYMEECLCGVWREKTLCTRLF